MRPFPHGSPINVAGPGLPSMLRRLCTGEGNNEPNPNRTEPEHLVVDSFDFTQHTEDWECRLRAWEARYVRGQHPQLKLQKLRRAVLKADRVMHAKLHRSIKRIQLQ